MGKDCKEDLGNKAAITDAMPALSGRPSQLDLEKLDPERPSGFANWLKLERELTHGFLLECTAPLWVWVLFSSQLLIVCFFPYSPVQISRRENLIGLVHQCLLCLSRALYTG